MASSPSMNGAASFKPPKKPRPGPKGVLAVLTTDQRAVLNRWLREGLFYKDIAARCKRELDFKISPASLSKYWSVYYYEIMRLTPPAVPGKTVELDLLLRIQI